jgi:hypothetical protein
MWRCRLEHFGLRRWGCSPHPGSHAWRAFAAGGMRLIVWIGGYAGQFFSAFTFLGLPLAFLPDMPPWLEPMLSQPAVFLIFIALVALVMLVIVVGVQIGVVIGLLSWTSRRASRLPFGYL